MDLKKKCNNIFTGIRRLRSDTLIGSKKLTKGINRFNKGDIKKII